MQKVIVKNYKGSQSETTTEFQKDAKKMAELGYYPGERIWFDKHHLHVDLGLMRICKDYSAQ